MSEVVLYDYWRSSASYRVRIALNLAGIAYRAQPVDLLTGAHKETNHLARNPQGLVPVLDIDGHRLTQPLAILEYLDTTRHLWADPARSAGRSQDAGTCSGVGRGCAPSMQYQRGELRRRNVWRCRYGTRDLDAPVHCAGSCCVRDFAA